MAETKPSDRLSLTITLTADLALRLRAVAESQRRAAADVVTDLLDRHLPQADAGPPKIPYA